MARYRVTVTVEKSTCACTIVLELFYAVIVSVLTNACS